MLGKQCVACGDSKQDGHYPGHLCGISPTTLLQRLAAYQVHESEQASNREPQAVKARINAVLLVRRSADGLAKREGSEPPHLEQLREPGDRC